jgi:hypothetical protein
MNRYVVDPDLPPKIRSHVSVDCLEPAMELI